MSDKQSQAELVSSAMDGETSDSLEWLCQDQDASKCWQRFHMIRDVIRGSQTTVLSKDFCSRVTQALEQEPAILSPRPLKSQKTNYQQRFLKPIAGFAIAASVTAVTVFGVQMLYRAEQPQFIAEHSIVENPLNSAAISQDLLVPVVSENTAEKVQLDSNDDNLDTYLLEHMGQFGSGSVQGAAPYVRLTGYGSSQ